jgi:hypothetical protein
MAYVLSYNYYIQLFFIKLLIYKHSVQYKDTYKTMTKKG